MENNEKNGLLYDEDPLTKAVKNLFGLSYLFPYQRLVITNILEAAQAAGLPIKWNEKTTETFEALEKSDRELLGKQIVILPTGAGKSLCFQLPAMLIKGITLVIYPILSLMADQKRRLEKTGFNPVVLRGGQSKEEREEIWRKLKNGQSGFIIANPEIMLTKQVQTQMEKIKVSHVVIDEAHCVSEWGESFRPSYLEIGSILSFLDPPLVTAFTATASAPVLEKIGKYIFNGIQVNQIVGNPDRPNISYSTKGCINRNLAVRDLLTENSRPAIVFCSSRPGTERLARYLRNEFEEMGLEWYREIRFYHAGLSKEEKTQIEKWFFNNKEAVLCSTCAYGMGVDKADIRTVIHRDCPPSVEAYLQESGRAGRDGEQSKAVLLFGPDDEREVERCKTDNSRITALLNYAKNIKNCRRHSLLELLNFDGGKEVPQENCCDVCMQKASVLLREEESVMEFFRKNKRCFSQYEAAILLAESTTVRWSQEEAGYVINHLIKKRDLKVIKGFLWKNKITIK
ncbi:MAG: RecQ family ATP-dependent DNA helicase [Treponema sp.]|nr:RecQ family ATP-dependent DNA helicase [Treponema sp.]